MREWDAIGQKLPYLACTPAKAGVQGVITWRLLSNALDPGLRRGTQWLTERPLPTAKQTSFVAAHSPKEKARAEARASPPWQMRRV
ncbi:hypothetical protein AN936_09535 [Sphingopyxis macrogoltabida]|uniref:Uncharacterized protein n=1 Tax=Sphingopyxis macrogoltabida TaxID=33050 RepID=A0A0N9UUT9_SPHMC|nr:hypothetical protein AN936_09535 [Sphingopyxis macrogoltabida]